MATPSYLLFAMGNPLLDMQVKNGEKLLEKYGLQANDSILADEKQMPIYEEIVAAHEIAYVAGGAAQNVARGAAYVLPPKTVVFSGAVGDDDLAEQLKRANEREGLDQVYLVKKGEKTGACAAIITGHDRSLVTTLRAAEKFEKSHLASPEVAPIIDNAKFFYVEGYFLTHGTESALEVSSKAAAAGKTFVLNLSAPFLALFFKKQIDQVLEHTDIVIGNEAEAEAYAKASGHETKNIADIAGKIACLPKSNPSKSRIVIFTQGADHTILVTGDKPDKPRTFPVDKLESDKIVDTNGAGDAFAGGFMGALVAGKNLDEAVLAGHALARASVQLVGPQYPRPKINIL